MKLSSMKLGMVAFAFVMISNFAHASTPPEECLILKGFGATLPTLSQIDLTTNCKGSAVASKVNTARKQLNAFASYVQLELLPLLQSQPVKYEMERVFGKTEFYNTENLTYSSARDLLGRRAKQMRATASELDEFIKDSVADLTNLINASCPAPKTE